MSTIARGRRRSAATGTTVRRGMTLVEVVVAMFILTGVLLTLGGFSARFAQANSQAHLVITANQIAASRLDEIRTQPSYAAVQQLASLPGRPDTIRADNTAFARMTYIKRVRGNVTADTLDYTLMTVVVTHPQMTKVVSKTTAIGAF